MVQYHIQCIYLELNFSLKLLLWELNRYGDLFVVPIYTCGLQFKDNDSTNWDTHYLLGLTTESPMYNRQKAQKQKHFFHPLDPCSPETFQRRNYSPFSCFVFVWEISSSQTKIMFQEVFIYCAKTVEPHVSEAHIHIIKAVICPPSNLVMLVCWNTHTHLWPRFLVVSWKTYCLFWQAPSWSNECNTFLISVITSWETT